MPHAAAPARPRPHALRVGALVALLLAATLSVPPAPATAVDRVVDLTFPVHDPQGITSFSDDYTSPRSRGDHGATDIGGPAAYGLQVHAAVGGTVRFITGLTSPLPSYGWMISIRGDDGRTYNYIHLGRQDGPASEAYAPGMAAGVRVERGQHIGFVGHSGNASASWPHLHFEIDDPQVTDRQGTNRINPYHSLVDAQRRGDLPGRTARPVEVEEVAEAERVAGFRDVPRGHAHADGIEAVATAGVTSGCGTERFCPDGDVSRGQMATFLTGAFDLPAGEPGRFDDVADDHVHAEGIAAVATAGIADGVGGDRFDPGAAITRAQLASFLAAALELDDVADHPFTDVAPDAVHAGAIGAVHAAEVASGRTSTTFGPADPVTRAQMATLLTRATDLG